MKSVPAAALLAGLVMLGPGGFVGASSGTVLVTNEIDKTVTVIDAATDKVLRTIAVPGRPRGIEALGGRVFVALSDSNRNAKGSEDAIVEMNARLACPCPRFDAGSDPERLVISADGTKLFAANEDAGTLTVTDIATKRLIKTLIVGIEPEGVALSPDGRWVYVTAETSNTVSVVDTKLLKVVSSFLVDARPRAAAFAPGGKLAYVTAEIGGSVTIVDAVRHRAIKRVKLAGQAHPVGVVVSPDGRTVYVATGHGNSVLFLNATTLSVIAQVPVGQRPWGIAQSADGSRLYTANGLSNDVSVVDVKTRRLISTIPAGKGAWGVALVY
jgi:PQQ-dependent catabolism-associated beta-propeller protein